MYSVTDEIANLAIAYPVEQLAPLSDILLIDIETTGFTAKSSCLYIIGCSYYENGSFYTRQWMAENYGQEKELLEAFFSFAGRFHHLIHFNGNNFDLPYLSAKCAQYELPYNFEQYEGIDIYKRIAPYKFFLKLPNCKQKTIENFLGIRREDTYTGGELIGIYHDYVKNPDCDIRNTLLLHNHDDLAGMWHIIPVLAYYDIFNGEIHAKKVQANHYTDYFGNHRQELLMTVSLPTALPVPLSVSVGSCCFKGDGKLASIRVPIYEEELKYFYANYKDYYYLPAEDTALHKSVATFVDKEHRVQATAATCYTRKQSQYLPQWEALFSPFFKREYKSRELFFELTDEARKNRSLFSAYAKHVLSMMCSTY